MKMALCGGHRSVVFVRRPVVDLRVKGGWWRFADGSYGGFGKAGRVSDVLGGFELRMERR